MDNNIITSAETIKTSKLTEQISKLIRSERRLYQIQGELDEQFARINKLNKFSLSIAKSADISTILSSGLEFIAANFVMRNGAAFIFDTKISKFSAVAKLSRGKTTEIIYLPINNIDQNIINPNKNVDILVINKNVSEDQRNKINSFLKYFNIIFDNFETDDLSEILFITSSFPDSNLLTCIIGYFPPTSMLAYREEIPDENDYSFINLFCKHLDSAIENTLSHLKLTELAIGLEKKVLNRTNEIEHRLQFETAIAKIAKEFSRLEFFQISEGIKNALSSLGKFIHVDRAYVFMFSDNNEKMSNTHEWCALGIQPFINELQNIPASQLPKFYATIKSTDILDISSVSSLPHSWNNEKIMWANQSIQSLLCIPLISKNKLIGFTGFDSTITRVWEKDDISLLLAFSEIITSAIERQKSGEKLEQLAQHDTLTNLPNRHQLETIVDTNIAFAKRHELIVGVLSVDLDNFKDINDTYGHDFGDSLLKEVAIRLTSAIRKEDFVARMGGDEFIVILLGLRKSDEAGIVAQKILDILKMPFNLSKHQIDITASIGIACYPVDGENRLSLLKNADIAMYNAKKFGKNKYNFFTKELQEQRQKQLEMEKALQYAIEKKEFYLVYQPQYNINQQIIGMEVLLRWENNILGLVSTIKFITLAEDRGLIIPIDNWVFKKAISQYMQWKQDGLIKDIKMGINVSSRHFDNLDICKEFSLAIEKINTTASFFELELTESVFINNPEFVKNALTNLSLKGFRIAIDDFGTGYSSLSYLKNLPIQRIKIDQSFVKSIGMEKNDEIIIEATIALGNKLNLEIIAEGVETEEQFQFLVNHGCKQFQGYYFSKPLKTEDMTALLKSIK